MKKFFGHAAKKLKKQYSIDVVDDILLGKKNRVLLFADVSHKEHIVLEVISNHLSLIGLDDYERISLKELISHVDYNNKYAEVSGKEKYQSYMYDTLHRLDHEMSITFPIIYHGVRTWINFEGFPIEKNPNIFAIFATNLTELMESEEDLYDKTHKDSLTHLLNKYSFDFHYGLRYQMKNVHILFLDVDDFKVINDTYGHSKGNEVLVAIANILKAYDTDLSKFYRIGGDEFIGMFFAPTEKVLKMADEILKKVETLTIEPVRKKITVSIGIIKGTIRDDMVRKADDLLYRAKTEGKNRYIFEIEV